MEFVVSAIVLTIGMIVLRLLVGLVAWLRSLRVVRAASRTWPAASSPSLAGQPELSAAQR